MSLRRIFIAIVVFAVSCVAAFAQTNCEQGNGTLDSEYPQNIKADQIIEKFTANESLLKEARTRYSYTQEVKIQTFFGPSVDGEYRQIAGVSYDEKGKRIENVTFAPVSSLTRISISPEDIDDIRTFSSFILTAEARGQYKIDYSGQQRVDELNTYAFDVVPVTIKPNTRYFKGRVWVDSSDLQIVKTCGKSVPDVIRTKKGKGKKGSEENIMPTFVTYRELIDGRYWFPSYSRSDDTLTFARDQVPLREIVKYTKYKRVQAEPEQTTYRSTEQKNKQ